jgi:hypothetical protein
VVEERALSRVGRYRGSRNLSRAPSRGGAELFLVTCGVGAKTLCFRHWSSRRVLFMPAEDERGFTMETSWRRAAEQSGGRLGLDESESDEAGERRRTRGGGESVWFRGTMMASHISDWASRGGGFPCWFGRVRLKFDPVRSRCRNCQVDESDPVRITDGLVQFG